MNSESKNILIVDDEEDLLDILEFKLEDLNLNIFSAKNGAYAFEVLTNNKIDIIVTDICMAGGTGVQLCKLVKESQYSSIPIIFVTGFSDHSIDQLYNMGAQSIFSKPLNYFALCKEIEKTINLQTSLWNREFFRSETNEEVSINVESLDIARIGRMLNFGMGGMFIQMEKDFPKKDELINFKIEIRIPEYICLEGAGKVRWIRTEKVDDCPPGVGIEFDSLSEKSIKKLKIIMNSIVTQSYIPSK